MNNDLVIRPATEADLPSVVALLAADEIGQSREDASIPLDTRYLSAFMAIEQDCNQLLAVGEVNDRVMACLQLSFIPGLSRFGSWRGQIESVRISRAYRGQGIGHTIFQWAIDECRRRNCNLVQLTTDKSRLDAARFYESLGFVASHVGMKLTFSS
ncbi:MAG: N-acetyltransferase family protein [Burkholderiaceae bacterium]